MQHHTCRLHYPSPQLWLHCRLTNTAARLPPPSHPNNTAMQALHCCYPDNAAAHPPLPWPLSLPTTTTCHSCTASATPTMSSCTTFRSHQCQVSLPLMHAAIVQVLQCRCQHQCHQCQCQLKRQHQHQFQCRSGAMSGDVRWLAAADCNGWQQWRWAMLAQWVMGRQSNCNGWWDGGGARDRTMGSGRLLPMQKRCNWRECKMDGSGD